MEPSSPMQQSNLDAFRSGSPVRTAPDDFGPGDLGSGESGPQPGIGLCLSGGGYRAMLFHVGLLIRLNEVGMLPRIDRVSSVSGGSITAGALARVWTDLDFHDGVASNVDDLVVRPLRTLAHTRIDVMAVLGGLASPLGSISDRVVSKLDDRLFHGATLQALPDRPTFIFNATNVESGVLMRFQKKYLADYRVGMVADPDILLAEAVTASASFPPFLSPFELDLADASWTDQEGNDLTGSGFRSEILLSDGGVYDNLGIETVWKRYRTVLVSDAGGAFGVEADPARDWARHILRILQIIDSQVRALRKRLVIDGFTDPHDEHDGFYVSTQSDLARFPVLQARPYLPVDPHVTARLARIDTRLSDLGDDDQEMLINWGYAVADAGLAGHLSEGVDTPVRLPYPDRPLG